MRIFLYVFFLILFSPGAFLPGQSTAFVFTGGPTFSNQQWDNAYEREMLLKWHFAVAVESVDNEENRAALLAQFGYHPKGSAIRFRYFVPNGPNVVTEEEFIFRNLSLILGAKQKFPAGENARFFYAGGIRGDYTLSTNLDELADNNPFAANYYPQDAFVRKWIFGLSIGGGTEWMFSELVGAQLTFWVHPDVTYQYDSPPIPNVIDPNNPGTITTLPARRVRNVALELSLGLRLLRKVEYVE